MKIEDIAKAANLAHSIQRLDMLITKCEFKAVAALPTEDPEGGIKHYDMKDDIPMPVIASEAIRAHLRLDRGRLADELRALGVEVEELPCG